VFSDPPDRSSFPYAGWVPCVNGRLSFRHIGEARYPTEARYANVTIDTQRLILVYQHRPLSDVLFQAIFHPLFNIQGSFYFALSGGSVGTPGNTDEIQGKIYIYKSKAEWRAKGKVSIRPRVNVINDLALSLDADRNAKIHFLHNEASGQDDGCYHLNAATTSIRSLFPLMPPARVGN
jgi:hypothetical protein